MTRWIETGVIIVVGWLLVSYLVVSSANITFKDEPINTITINEDKQEIKVTTDSGTYYPNYWNNDGDTLKINPKQKYYLTVPKQKKYRDFISKNKYGAKRLTIDLIIKDEKQYKKDQSKVRKYDLKNAEKVDK